MADLMGVDLRLVRRKRSQLDANGFLPDCSPFSERWMSALNNTRSKTELGMTYTPVRDYLRAILEEFERHPPAEPISYRRRKSEIQMALEE